MWVSKANKTTRGVSRVPRGWLSWNCQVRPRPCSTLLNKDSWNLKDDMNKPGEDGGASQNTRNSEHEVLKMGTSLAGFKDRK